MVKTRYELVEGNASSFAGLFAVSEFLRKIKFDRLWAQTSLFSFQHSGEVRQAR